MASRHLSTWWLQLSGVQLKGGFGKFDPWFIFLQTGHDDKYKYNRPIEEGEGKQSMVHAEALLLHGSWTRRLGARTCVVWDEDQKKLVRQPSLQRIPQKDKTVLI